MPAVFVIEPIINEIDQLASSEIADIVIQATESLRDESPVDTGNLSYSWLPSFGALPSLQPTFRNRPERAEHANLQKFRQQGAIDSLNDYSVMRDGDLVITNNTTYIEEVEQKQPFVDRALTNAGVA